MCTSNMDDRKLENTVKQSRFKHLGELHKEWTEAGVNKLKELDCCSVVQSPLFRWKSILHFIWKSGSQSLEEEWRGTESTLLEVQCEVSTVSDGLGCHVICWCWSTVFSEVHSQRSHLPGHFRALHASCYWPTLWRCWFHFPAGLGNIWGIVKRKMRDTRPNNAEELKDAIKATWALLHLSSATGWLPPCHTALML